jgi:hypothetical protein
VRFGPHQGRDGDPARQGSPRSLPLLWITALGIHRRDERDGSIKRERNAASQPSIGSRSASQNTSASAARSRRNSTWPFVTYDELE